MAVKIKTLTYEQARELKWFCDNCTGLKTEYYAILDKVNQFEEKLVRLEKTCILINKFLSDCGDSAERSGNG